MGVDRWSYTQHRSKTTMRKIRLLLLALCLLQYLESPTSGKMYLVETKEKDNGNGYNKNQPVLADSTSTKELDSTTSGEPMLNSEEQAIQNQDLPLLQQPPSIFGRQMKRKKKGRKKHKSKKKKKNTGGQKKKGKKKKKKTRPRKSKGKKKKKNTRDIWRDSEELPQSGPPLPTYQGSVEIMAEQMNKKTSAFDGCIKDCIAGTPDTPDCNCYCKNT